ncbi:hypothetical protein POM88_053227 [Heracleum sosnowskyi]|uniref:Uncharacterized protein n=1 Tax=Heracleum sosnowskyi TaxID=360622 RepID=A0AAD8LVX9_9APIA|nr:hypothetical protein POM88_053227 [Heracleum sosnowskyi]
MEGMELNQEFVRTLKTGYMEIKKEYKEVSNIVPWNLSVLPSELQARIFDIVPQRKEKMEVEINDVEELFFEINRKDAISLNIESSMYSIEWDSKEVVNYLRDRTKGEQYENIPNTSMQQNAKFCLMEPVCVVKIQELEQILLGEKDCGLNQMLGKLFEEMQRPYQIMGCRTLESDFLSTDNSLSLYLDVLNAMVNLPVSIVDYLIVDKNVKDLLYFDWEKAKYAQLFYLGNVMRSLDMMEIFLVHGVTFDVSFSSEIAKPAVCDVQTNSLKEPHDKKKLNKPTNMWFKLKESIHTCVIELVEDVTYDEMIRVFLRCSKIKDNHQTKKNYEEICVNKGTIKEEVEFL